MVRFARSATQAILAVADDPARWHVLTSRKRDQMQFVG